MRILYIDIDTLRPDHLGCYGYHRNTSPNLDALARDGVTFQNCYNTDAPCLPSRAALWSGRCGFHTGVVNHGGTAADPFIEGPTRGFRDVYDATSWMSALRRAGAVNPRLRAMGLAIVGAAWLWAIVTVGAFIVRVLTASPDDPNPPVVGDFTRQLGPLIVAATVILPAIVAAVFNWLQGRREHVLAADRPATGAGDRAADHAYSALILPLAELVRRIGWGVIVVL